MKDVKCTVTYTEMIEVSRRHVIVLNIKKKIMVANVTSLYICDILIAYLLFPILIVSYLHIMNMLQFSANNNNLHDYIYNNY